MVATESGTPVLADRLAVGLLTWAFPPERIDRVLERTGRTQVRTRLLPARVSLYFVLALCLFPELNYERIAELLSQGMRWVIGRPTACPSPTAAALSRARLRLGPEPLRALFEETGAAVLDGARADADGGGFRVLALDFARFAVPVSEENVARFGGACVDRTGSCPESAADGLPQVQVLAMAHQNSRTVVGAELGSVGDGRLALARPLLRTLRQGDLLLADLTTVDARSWCIAREHGAELLWSVPATTQLPQHAVLSDGSYRSVLDGAGWCASGDDSLAVPVRVVDRVVDGTRVQLITSLLNAKAAPAARLAELHASRWRFEDALDELDPARAPGPRVLRARSVSGVEQEVWGHLLVHQAISALLRPDSVVLRSPVASPVGESDASQPVSAKQGAVVVTRAVRARSARAS